MKIIKRITAILLITIIILPLSACFDPSYEWNFPERKTPDFDWSMLGALTGDGTMTESPIDPSIEPPTEIEDGLEYMLSEDGGHYIVTGAVKRDLTDIAIPSSHNGIPVKAIADGAFAGLKQLCAVDIPDSIEKVGEGAFDGCDRLEYSVAQGGKYLGGGENEFAVLVGRADDSTLSIVTSARVIADGAFAEDELLEVISIPSSLLYIGDRAFMRCKKLKQLVFEAGYRIIGDSAFRECTSLMNMNRLGGVYDSVTYAGEIGDYAFYGCTALQDTILTMRTRMIGKWAFGNCESLVSITVGRNLETIEERSFSGCTNLSWLTLESGVKSIEPYAFYGCTALREVSLPSGIENIAFTAFSGCSLQYSTYSGCRYLGNMANEYEYLMDMIGSEKVMKIHPRTRRLRQGVIASNPQLESIQMLGAGAYLHVAGDCLIDTEQKKVIAGLPTAVIPSDGSVSAIADYAFAETEKMSITAIPDSVTEIGDYAFFACRWMREISFGDSLEYIGDYAFSKTMLTELEIPHSVTHVGEYAFAECDNLRNIQLGQNITLIEDGIFSYCSNLIALTHGGELTSIGAYAFRGCAFEQFDFNDGLEYIGAGAFMNCNSLKEATLPDSMIAIDDLAFSNCLQILRISLGRDIYRIGVDALSSIGTADIDYRGTVAEWENIAVCRSTANYTQRVRCTDGWAQIPGTTTVGVEE